MDWAKAMADSYGRGQLAVSHGPASGAGCVCKKCEGRTESDWSFQQVCHELWESYEIELPLNCSLLSSAIGLSYTCTTLSRMGQRIGGNNYSFICVFFPIFSGKQGQLDHSIRGMAAFWNFSMSQRFSTHEDYSHSEVFLW